MHNAIAADGTKTECGCELGVDHGVVTDEQPGPITDTVATRDDIITGTAQEGQVGELVE